MSKTQSVLAVRRRRFHVTPSKVITYVLLSVWAVGTVYPFLWVVQNSFKLKGQIRSNSFSLPTSATFTLDNYFSGFEKMDVGAAYRNSLIISGTVTVAVIILGGLAAYGLARYNFRGRKLLHSLVIAAMMFPVFATIIPVYRLQFGWGIVNTTVPLSWLSVILPQTAGNLAFATVILMGFIRSLPIDLEEAAYLEGYGVMRIFFKIIMPLARPSFATVGIFAFLWSYNDLFTQDFFLRSKDYFTITLMLNQISSLKGTDYGLMCAAVVMVVIPVLIVYIFLQKNIIKGLTAGAIKG